MEDGPEQRIRPRSSRKTNKRPLSAFEFSDTGGGLGSTVPIRSLRMQPFGGQRRWQLAVSARRLANVKFQSRPIRRPGNSQLPLWATGDIPQGEVERPQPVLDRTFMAEAMTA
jgi:hypothetical protein